MLLLSRKHSARWRCRNSGCSVRCMGYFTGLCHAVHSVSDLHIAMMANMYNGSNGGNDGKLFWGGARPSEDKDGRRGSKGHGENIVL